MPSQSKKLDAKSRKLLKELEDTLAVFGGADYAPTGFASAQTGTAGQGFQTAPIVRDEEFRRLKAWLAELADAEKPDSVSILLQVWLDAHGIVLPKRVFKLDLTSYGSGVLKGRLGREASALRGRGKTWGKIALQLIPDECKTQTDRQKASDRVRLAADAYKNGVRREKPIEGSVAALAWKMLDVKPDWAIEQELRDDLDR